MCYILQEMAKKNYFKSIKREGAELDENDFWTDSD